jgi:hypothetical protein
MGGLAELVLGVTLICAGVLILLARITWLARNHKNW